MGGDELRSESNDRGLGWGKVLVTGAVLVTLIALAVSIARMVPITHRFYTDADVIKEPVDTARTRDILWQPPRGLDELVNTSAGDYEPRMSADGLTLFFVRGRTGDNADIYYSRRTAVGWTSPVPLFEVNSAYEDLGPEPAADGRSIHFYSDRPGGCGGYDLWAAHRTDEGWQPPVNLGPGVNSEFNDYGPALAPDGGTLYFASNRPRPPGTDQTNPDTGPAASREDPTQRDYDLYSVAVTDAGMGEAAPLSELNTPQDDGAPAVSSFGDFLYFASDRPGGEGGFDLYRSRRLGAELGAPLNLGPMVNTPANELDPGLSLGGYALYFSSDRPPLGVRNVPQPRERTTPGPTSARDAAEQPAQPAQAAAVDESTGEYNLYYTTSREVFTEIVQRERPPIDWAALWSRIGPHLMGALLALLLLVALVAFLRDARGRGLSLLTKCLVASLAAHFLFLFLLSAWEVTASLAGELNRRGRVRVALTAASMDGDLLSQVRGAVTSVNIPAAADVEPQRREPTSRLEAVDTRAELSVARHRIAWDSSPTVDVEAADAVVPDESQPPEPADVLADVAQAVRFEMSVPKQPDRMDAAEQDGVAEAVPVEPAAPDRPAVRRLVRASADAGIDLAPVAQPDDIASAQAERSSMADLSAARDVLPPVSAAKAKPSDAITAVDAQMVRDLPPPQESSRRVAEDTETDPQITLPASTVARRELRSGGGQRSAPIELHALTPNSTEAAPDSSFVADPTKHAADLAGPTAETTATVTTKPTTEFTLPRLADLALAAPTALSGPLEREVLPEAVSALTPSTRRRMNGRLRPDSTRLDAFRTKPRSVPMFGDPSSLADVGDRPAVDAVPDDARSGEIGEAAVVAALPALSSLELPSLEQSAFALRAERLVRVGSIATTAPRSAWRMGDEAGSTLATIDMVDLTPVSDGDLYVPSSGFVNFTADDRTAAPPTALPAVALSHSDLIPTSPWSALDLTLPDETRPPDNPYAQRLSDERLGIVKRMGGSEETERAVEEALRWLAAHQSDDGYWDGDGFDRGCGRCGGETEIAVDRALTGLALLAFLGAGHTHTTDGPYRETVERGVRWLQRQQSTDGDLRGDETMYTQGIATIALSEAYGMTGDATLVEHVRRAVRFIDGARNTDKGGWRYDPGQAGDTSVLGWQVMALKSATMNGVPVSAVAFNAARKWLDRVSKRSKPGLYAYQKGRSSTPSMTAEGMFTQQLLGRRRADPRMQMSAEYVVQHLPDWGTATNTYYWYYGTLALFQHQGDEWRTWNDVLTEQLLTHQRKDAEAAGSWDPEGEWADKGGRVYQTALCAMMLEVYYRYLPLYTLEEPADAIGRISGMVTEALSGAPVVGASVHLTLPDRDPVIATTDFEGRYTLFVPEVPNFFALSASHEGFVPTTQNVDAAMLEGTTLKLDFELARENEAIVAVEAVPEVHHLGDNKFEGTINSQFQKESEGAVFEADFELTATQVPPHIRSVEVRLLCKGVQRSHKIRINRVLLDKRLDDAPRDGSFGEFTATFDADLLKIGHNTIEIIAKPSTSDIDDFEFVNVRILVSP